MNGDTTRENTSQWMLGRYRLLKKIGRGGMGEVWLGEDPRLHRQVAIKTLPVHNQSDNEFLQRFQREARAAATLNHPHILPVHDFGEQTLANGQTITYIVMPFVAGGTLSDRIALHTNNQTLMSPLDAISYLVQAAEGIDYAHMQGILHRDIKPSNMLLRNDNWLFLADFGIARILSDQESLTQTGTGFGTPEYMSPEQAQGRAVPASDSYSLAVIAYQLCTGRLPFLAESAYATTIQHIVAPPPPPREINPQLAVAVEQALLQGLAKAPEQRFPSAGAFVATLQAACANTSNTVTYLRQPFPQTQAVAFNFNGSGEKHTTSVHPTVASEGNAATATPRRLTRRTLLVSGGVALLAAGGLGTWAIISDMQSGPTHIQKTTTPASQHPATIPPDPNSPAFTLVSHTQPVTALAWSPKANILASVGQDNQVMLWDVPAIQQGEFTANKPKAAQSIDGTGMLLAWSPDGTMLAIGNINPHNNDFNNAYISLYTSDLGGTVPGFSQPLKVPNFSLNAMAWTPNPYLVTATNLTATTSLSQCQIAALSVKQGAMHLATTTIPAFVSLSSDIVLNPLAFSPDGSRVAIGTTTGVVTGQLSVAGSTVHWRQDALRAFNDLPLAYEADTVAWSPDGHSLAATSVDPTPTSTLALWDSQNSTKKPVALTLPNSGAMLETLAWSPAPGSTLLAAGGKDGSVSLWNVAPRQGNTLPTRNLTGLNASVKSLAWSFDGQWLAAAYGDLHDSILIWKV